MKPTLCILAAGMGSRYGGLKQMDAFGPNGETILDYSIYDAIQAGFGKVVFIIRESFSDAFKDFFKGKFEDKVAIEYVYQNIADVPDGTTYGPDREKPWGTAHAVWVARKVIKEPFVVINADDYYGADAYSVVVDYLKNSTAENYALVAYQLDKTLSEHGTVNRGVCQSNNDRQLTGVVETLKIGYTEDGSISYPTEDGEGSLAPETLVSMNYWLFHPDFFEHAEAYFVNFLKEFGGQPKSEFFIPLLIEHLINNGSKIVDVLECSEEWFGVTYAKDKPFVQERIAALIEKEVYPKNLWIS